MSYCFNVFKLKDVEINEISILKMCIIEENGPFNPKKYLNGLKTHQLQMTISKKRSCDPVQERILN